jgi:hypothetical protein
MIFPPDGNIAVPAHWKEVTRLRKFLKWFDRFWFKVKLEFEAGFNKDQDR